MKSPIRLFSGLAILAASFALPAVAALQVASPFGDHMVLQRDRPVPVWGMADAGQRVTVKFAGQVKAATADANGRWQVTLDALPASAAPESLTISAATNNSGAAEARSFQDVLVGEVWLCGGQSNMERQLGLRPGQKPIVDWEREAAAADFPQIRQLYVVQRLASTPQSTAEMSWTVCSPATAPDFTAVGFFFARQLHEALRVPIGIIHSSWGGTPAEAWTSQEGLQAFPEFSDALEQMQAFERDPDGAERTYRERIARWYEASDPGSRGAGWQEPALDTHDWETMNLPTMWENAGRAGFDGVGWFRRRFDLPSTWQGGDVELHLSAIDDLDTTWVNGQLVGATDLWLTPRVYRVPAAALKRQGNVIAVRVLDTGGNGGIWNPELPLEARSLDGSFAPIPLTGAWRARFSVAMSQVSPPPRDPRRGSNNPTVLYNGMIAPLVPYAIRGVTFYQGESNADRPQQYRALFPALIADWRRAWQQGDFPFLFVQIAPFKDQPPEIREAQLLAWQATKHTAMVVTLDHGDAEDIHPADKRPVGERLALAARALAYGEPVEYSGPVYSEVRFNGRRAELRFSHLGGGLVAHDGPLTGFTLAGADGVFHPADAQIVGNTVLVSSSAVLAPTAVRYAWANVASGNLFNRAGLPASPFRTDAPVTR